MTDECFPDLTMHVHACALAFLSARWLFGLIDSFIPFKQALALSAYQISSPCLIVYNVSPFLCTGSAGSAGSSNSATGTRERQQGNRGNLPPLTVKTQPRVLTASHTEAACRRNCAPLGGFCSLAVSAQALRGAGWCWRAFRFDLLFFCY